MSDDDDMPAIETNAAPERAPRRAFQREDSFDDEGQRPRNMAGRHLSESTRALMKAAAEKVKQQIDDGGGDDDMEPAITTEPAAAGAPQAAATAPSQTTPTADAAPAAAPSPTETAASAIAAERMAQLEAREKLLAEKEAQVRDHRGRFKEDHVETLKEMIRDAHGLGPNDDIKPYAMDLVTELSGEVLGLDVPQDVRARQERKKAERLIREHNQQLTKREQDLSAKEKERTERDQRAAVVGNIKLELSKPERMAKHPWLMASSHDGDPADIVYGVAKAIIDRDPTWKPSLDDAAERANKFYEQKARADYERYKHLLNPASPKPQPSTTTAPQERPSGSRSSATLTNTAAAEAPSARAIPPARPMTNEDRRRASMRKFSSSIPAQTDD